MSDDFGCRFLCCYFLSPFLIFLKYEETVGCLDGTLAAFYSRFLIQVTVRPGFGLHFQTMTPNISLCHWLLDAHRSICYGAQMYTYPIQLFEIFLEMLNHQHVSCIKHRRSERSDRR